MCDFGINLSVVLTNIFAHNIESNIIFCEKLGRFMDIVGNLTIGVYECKCNPINGYLLLLRLSFIV